jgi:1,2-diacylglycerol 3-alpha-glucosyltransferase
MNIGIFTDTFDPEINGVVTSINSAINYFEPNHACYVFCPKVSEKIQNTEKVWRFPSVVFPFQKEYRLAIPWNQRLKKIKALNLDVIHIHTPFGMGLIGLKVAKKLNIPVIHTYHTYFEKYLHYIPILPESWVYKYAKKESERFCNQCQLIISPSEEMREQLEKFNITTRIITLASGINKYIPTESECQNLKDRYTLKDKKTCCFVGRISQEKNVVFLVNAFKKINQNVPESHLMLVGDGPETKNIKTLIKELDLDQHITLTGYLPKEEVFTALTIADVMLFPSKTETQGLTVVESLQCGTPVVGLNYMGVKEVLQNEQGGVLTEESTEAYAKAAIELLTNASKVTALSKAAIIRGEDFSSYTINQKLEAEYKKIIEEKKSS